MTIVMVFMVGWAFGFVAGLFVNCLCSSSGSTPPLFGKAPAPRRQKKLRANEGTIFSRNVVQGGIH